MNILHYCEKSRKGTFSLAMNFNVFEGNRDFGYYSVKMSDLTLFEEWTSI